MAILIALVLAAIAVGLIYLASLDGAYEVRRSLLMKVDRLRVFNKLRDLRSWPEWSPWLMHEPETSLEFSEQPLEVYVNDPESVSHSNGIITRLYLPIR